MHAKNKTKKKQQWGEKVRKNNSEINNSKQTDTRSVGTKARI